MKKLKLILIFIIIQVALQDEVDFSYFHTTDQMYADLEELASSCTHPF